MCAKGVPKLWILSEKSKNFDKKKWSKLEQPKSKQPKSDKLKFPQTTASSMELFVVEIDLPYLDLLFLRKQMCPEAKLHPQFEMFVQTGYSTLTTTPSAAATRWWRRGPGGSWTWSSPTAWSRSRSPTGATAAVSVQWDHNYRKLTGLNYLVCVQDTN